MATVIEELVYVLRAEADTSEIEEFGEAADSAEESHRSLGSTLVEGAKRAAAYAAAIAAAGAALTAKLVVGAAEAQDEIAKTARTYGFSAQELQRLRFAAEAVGAPVQGLTRAAKDLQARLGEVARGGAKPVADALDDLGLSVEDFQGLGLEDQFGLIADSLNAVEDPAQRASLSMQLLGGQGQKLNNLLLEGSEGLRELGDAAEEYGAVVNDEALAASEDFTQTMQEAKATLNALRLAVANELIPIVRDWLARLRDWVTANRDLIRTRIVEFMRGFIEVLTQAAEIVAVLAEHWEILVGLFLSTRVASAFSTIAAGFTAMGVSAGAALGPIGLVAAALTALIPIAVEAGNAIGDALARGAGVGEGPTDTDKRQAVALIEDPRLATQRNTLSRRQREAEARAADTSLTGQTRAAARAEARRLGKQIEGINAQAARQGAQRKAQADAAAAEDAKIQAAGDAEADALIAEFEAEQAKKKGRRGGGGKKAAAAAGAGEEAPSIEDLVRQAAGGPGLSSLAGRGGAAGLGGVFVTVDASFGPITLNVSADPGSGTGTVADRASAFGSGIEKALEPVFRRAFDHYRETVRI